MRIIISAQKIWWLFAATVTGFFETQGRDRQYALKDKPINQQTGEFKGLLAYDKRELVFKVGGTWYENVPTILQYRDQPIISCKLSDGQALVSLTAFDEKGQIVMQVRDSEVTFRIDNLWDFECKKNIAIARSGRRKISLKIDFSQPEATIEGSLWAGGIPIELGRDRTNLADNMIVGGRMKGLAVGIHLG